MDINQLPSLFAIAQLVEQRTENPCVPGSIPGGTTENERVTKVTLFSFCLKYRHFKIKVKPRVKPKINMSEGINILCYKSKTLANGEHPLMVRVGKASLLCPFWPNRIDPLKSW